MEVTVHAARCGDLVFNLPWRLRVKKCRYAVFAALAGLFMASGPVLAHHGTAAYETTKLTTVKGTAMEFKFINPHVEITVEVKDDKGKIEKWLGEANSPNVLSRHGWSKEIIKPGDQITVIGYRAKNGSYTLRLQKVVLSDGQELDPNSLQD
jgi:Family of unknown function (DUF6152)